MPSRSFIEKLLLRLKSGDARSIHLNALPGNFARLDLYDLVNIEQGLHHKFLQELLTKKSFRFSITIDPSLLNAKPEDETASEKKKILQKIIKRLNHLDYQEKQEFAEHGYHSFGFGYPLLIKRDTNNRDRILKAPLLIWYMDIEKDHRRNNTWTISRNEDHPLIFNELLQAHLESVEEIKAGDLNEVLDDDFVSEADLNMFCKAVLGKLNVPFDAEENIATILPSTNKETIENISSEVPWIRWSGVFGLYKMQKQPIIKDLQNLLDSKLEDTVEREDVIFFDGEVLTPVVLDPSQENVLQQLKQTNRVVIQGPPGTGKSQSLTAIITQALLNKKKVLVVCEKRTAMEVLFENLKKENLHHLCAMVEDVYADRKTIVEHVRFLMEQPPATVRFRNNEYETVRSKFLSLQEEINHRINFTTAEVFGDDNWLELLVRSFALNSHREIYERANSINKSIRTDQFQFNYAEYAVLSEKIRAAENLFFKVKKDAFVFDALHITLFTSGISEEELFAGLNELYISGKSLEEKISANIQQFDDSYNLLAGFQNTLVNILSFVSARYKTIRREKDDTLSAYAQLKAAVSDRNYFSMSFPEVEYGKLESLLPIVHSLKEQAVHFLAHRNLFPDYFNFKQFFETQDEKTKSMLRFFMAALQKDWEAIFETWYVNGVVLKTSIQHGIKADTPELFEALLMADHQLRQKLSEKINFIWQEEIRNALETRDAAELKYLYNQRKNKQYTAKNPLRKIIHEDFDFFTTLLPVLMVNPAAASSILPLRENLFDLIILDEASQLRLEDTYSCLLRAKTIVISGDKHQMPPSSFFTSDILFWNEEEQEAENFLAESKSLLEFADDANYKNTFLDFHYRSLHPNLIGFSNHAFYQSRLVPMPEKEAYKPMHYIALDGLYSEGINADEARAIVQFIFSIEKINEAYPSIGIATFNIYQRDMIYDALYEQAYTDKEKSEKLQELINRGLFVKNLENIQGDERDIMILSTTFGKDEHGKFRQAFGPLTQEKGYQLLNVIITRAKHSLYVFTSIPESVFLNFDAEMSQKGNTGKSVFYAYLAYVKAVSENDTLQKEFIEERLQKNNTASVSKDATYRSSFKESVFESLKTLFGDVQRDYKLGGFTLDMVIFKNGNPILHIDLEHVENYHPEVSYRIKIHRQKMVEAYGIQTYHLWSFNWWMNARAEMDKISVIVNEL